MFLEFCDTGCQTAPETIVTVEIEVKKSEQDSNTVNAESQTEPIRDVIQEHGVEKQQDTDDNIDKVRNISSTDQRKLLITSKSKRNFIQKRDCL